MALTLKSEKNGKRLSLFLYQGGVKFFVGVSVKSKKDIAFDSKVLNTSFDKNIEEAQTKIDRAFDYWHTILKRHKPATYKTETLKALRNKLAQEAKEYINGASKISNLLKQESKEKSEHEIFINNLTQTNQVYIDDYVDKWIEDYKKGLLGKNTDKKPSERTIYAYGRIKNNLVDFQTHEKGVNRRVSIYEFDLELMIQLHDFLKINRTPVIETKKKDEEGNPILGKGKKIGGFSQKNLLHFNVAFKAYLKYVGKKHSIRFDDDVMEFSIEYTKNIETIVALDKKQFRDLHEKVPKNEIEQRKKDIILFLLNTGMAVVDMANLKSHNFKKHIRKDGSVYYSVFSHRQKNGQYFSVPLSSVAEEIILRNGILEKEGYSFTHPKVIRRKGFKTRIVEHKISSKSLTSWLRKFWYDIESFYEGENSKANTEYYNEYGEIEIKQVDMRDKFSAHRARNTFISLHIESHTPLNILLGYLGWTKSSTLDVYLQRFRKNDTDDVERLVVELLDK